MYQIYKITNKKTAKVYIGCTSTDLSSRISRHRGAYSREILRGGYSIRVLRSTRSRHVASKWEAYYVEKYDSTNPQKGYNRNGGGFYGYRVSEKTRKAMIRSNSERQISKATRKKMSESHLGMRPSLKSRRKMSRSHIGLRPSAKTRMKLHMAQLGNTKMLGKKHSKATRIKISLARRRYEKRRKALITP